MSREVIILNLLFLSIFSYALPFCAHNILFATTSQGCLAVWEVLAVTESKYPSIFSQGRKWK